MTKKSTGPKTVAGKSIASQNAVRHGFLSRRLLLNGEDPQEFQNLFDSLAGSLHPRNALEAALVEKIAACLWRQRRLLTAEVSQLALQEKARLLKFLHDHRDPDDTASPDLNTLSFAALEAIGLSDKLNTNELSLEEVQRQCPALVTQLTAEAAAAGVGLPDFLYQTGGIASHVAAHAALATQVIREASQAELVKDILRIVQKNSVTFPGSELLLRYQTALDNELYRALRMFKELRNSDIGSDFGA